jgi:ankyrin repeat protein
LISEASKHNQPNILKILLAQKGCQLNCIDRDGFTPLMQAAMHGSVCCVRLLCMKKVNLKQTRDLCREEQFTALHYCAMYDKPECA